MLPNASIVHQIPGRVRIRIPSAKGDYEFLEQARAALSALPHVLDVTCNAWTGSLLIVYSQEFQREFENALALGNGSATTPFVLQAVSNSSTAPARETHGKPRRSELSRAVTEVVIALDDAVRESTGNLLDLKTLLPLAVGGAGLMLLGRTKGTPLWLTLLIFGFSSFVTLHGAASESGIESLAEEALE